MPLSLAVRIFQLGARAVATRTTNISSEGFYCVVSEPFRVGDVVRCILEVPSFNPTNASETMVLDCRVKIIRVETLTQSGFGIACVFQQYNVRSKSDDNAPG